MFSALDQITFRQWQRHKLRLALTILGIALGVAVFFAVRTANRTLISSLNVTIEKLAGKATLQIVAGEAGFQKELIERVRATTGVSEAEPVTETFATTTLNGEKLLILGLDTSSDLKIYEDSFDQGNISIKNPLAFASRGDSIAVTRSFANRFALKEGDKITVDVAGGRREMTVRGLFSASGAGSVFDGNVAVMDIAAAQDAFGRQDRIDRIDLANTPEVSSDQVQENLKAWLPSGITAVRPNLRGQGLENAVSSMHYGLAIMSSLALTIGIFIIFNSFSISLNQRWKEIGVLRALGVTRGQVQRMFLAEAALMGVIGSVIGVAAGYGLAMLSMGFVGNAMASFYGFASSPQAPEFNVSYGMQALLAGIVTSLIAAWLPARVASRLQPALALHNVESRQRESIIGLPRLVTGVVLVIASVALIRFADPNVGVNFQLFYCFVGQLGLILLVPKITQIGARIIRPVLNKLFGVEGLIAVETMANAPRRTTATVIALMIGLGLVFSHESFIRSQKAAMDRALDKALSSDMLVNASGEIHSRTYHISEDTANRIGALPDVAKADPVRVTTVSYNGQDVTILAHDMDAYFAISPDLLDVGDVGKARAATARGEGMLVSTNFATRFGLGLGDKITLDTPTGPLPLTIAGMLDYYRSEKGTIFMERSLYKKYWRDTDVDTILLDLKDGADHQAVRGEINKVLAGQQAFIYTHEEFRRWVSVIVDQFFALMYVQMAIAFLVAVLGLVNTMVISVAERRRELGIFRAVGGLRRQVSKMIMLEAVAIALIGLFAGTISGLLNAYFLVKTAARVVAGYTLPLTFPASMILWAIPVIVILAIISAWFPARKAGRLNVVDAIGYE
jgi:putative ABC transport system permease protein